jgi:hypothetical protein
VNCFQSHQNQKNAKKVPGEAGSFLDGGGKNGLSTVPIGGSILVALGFLANRTSGEGDRYAETATTS